MRILIVHNILWAHYKSSVFQALQRLVDNQPDVTVKVLQIARSERSRTGMESVTDSTAPTYAYDYELLFDRYIENVSLFDRTRVLLQRVRAFRPDVINLTGYYDPAQVMILLWAKANGVRVIMQNESTVADQQRGSRKEQFKKWLFDRCDGFFCFGNQSANYLISIGADPAKILLRRNAVDNDTIQSVYEQALPTRTERQQALTLKPNNFVFVGRLIEFKNLPLLLDAFAKAIKTSSNGKNWGLLILGDGTERTKLVNQVNELGLAGSVSLLPGRPWYEVPEILALSNILVLPSRSEPWGLVVNEAMACGLPVLVSDRCGCVPDLVHDGQNGFVFDPNQPDQLVRRMAQFMDGTVDTHQMSQAAKQLIATYSPNAVAQDMLRGFIKVTS
ncbi:glycosyltransferase family 4 protein [Spirosoma agri]|uniref:Glycosyltransferase family 4 protein n=1 Tax=Spirosoma agri TaxID=1987381 RepID=A0A6M0IDP3_9BACT|nr:glycosyltransferase family 4 protein [Spirosoma agri]NEU66410.1 glycosyltransferase family 4 protein [Spirosoma agri]